MARKRLGLVDLFSSYLLIGSGLVEIEKGTRECRALCMVGVGGLNLDLNFQYFTP